MKIGILGGTRFFGKIAVHYALEKGAQVIVGSRRAPPADIAGHVQWVNMNRDDPHDLRKFLALGPYDLVIDNIAYTGTQVQTLLSVLPADRVGRYLVTSTGAVYFDYPWDHGPVLESEKVPGPKRSNSPHDYGWKYSWGKKQVEDVVTQQTQVPWTIIRPPIVVGPEDPFGRLEFYLNRMLQNFSVIETERPFDNLISQAFSYDLGRVLVEAGLHPKAENEIFNITSDEPMSLMEYLKLIAQFANLDPKRVPSMVLQKKGVHHPYDFSSVLSAEKAKTLLGFRPTPVHQWLKTTVDWHLRKPR